MDKVKCSLCNRKVDKSKINVKFNILLCKDCIELLAEHGIGINKVEGD